MPRNDPPDWCVQPKRWPLAYRTIGEADYLGGCSLCEGPAFLPAWIEWRAVLIGAGKTLDARAQFCPRCIASVLNLIVSGKSAAGKRAIVQIEGDPFSCHACFREDQTTGLLANLDVIGVLQFDRRCVEWMNGSFIVHRGAL